MVQINISLGSQFTNTFSGWFVGTSISPVSGMSQNVSVSPNKGILVAVSAGVSDFANRKVVGSHKRVRENRGSFIFSWIYEKNSYGTRRL